MKLSIFLALFISVGAWGQTTKFNNCALAKNSLTFVCNEGSVYIEMSNTYDSDRSSMIFTIEKRQKPEPMDIPAIQDGTEKRKTDSDSDGIVVGCDVGFYLGIDEDAKKWACYRQRWSCADKSRTLMETLDGKTHYCHKPQLTSH